MSLVLNVEKFISDVYQRPAIWNRNYHCNKAFMEETWKELSQRHALPVVTLKAKWKGLRDNFRVEYKRIPRDEQTGEMLIPPEDHESKWIHYKALLFLSTNPSYNVEHMRARAPKENGLMPPKMEPYYYSDSFDYDDRNTPSPLPLKTELLTPMGIETNPMRRNRDGLIEIPEHYSQQTMNLNGVTLSLGKITSPKQSRTMNGNGAGGGGGDGGGGVGDRRAGNDSMKRRRIEDDDGYDDDFYNDYSNGTNTHRNNHNHTNDSPAVQKDDDYHFLMSMHPYFGQLPAEKKLKIRMKMQKLIFRELYEEEAASKPNNNNRSKVISGNQNSTSSSSNISNTTNHSNHTNSKPVIKQVTSNGSNDTENSNKTNVTDKTNDEIIK